MTTLIFDMQTAFFVGVTEKAPQALENLGIKWTEAHPQPIFAQWKFCGCTNVPDVLPEYLTKQPAQQEPVAKPFAWANTDDLCADTAFRWCEIGDHKTPVYTAPQAQRTWVGMTDEDRAILEAVQRELDDVADGNAPGHGHRIAGIWDEDNGDLAGKPCAWCLTWAKFTALIDREAAHNIKDHP